MPIYRVPVKTVTIEILHVRARSAYEAMEKALDESSPPDCTFIEEIVSGSEVYYPDIYEVQNPAKPGNTGT